MKMTTEQRLRLISQIAFDFDGDGDDTGYWIIGMLCDLSLSEDALNEQIVIIKKHFPSLVRYFEEIG